MIIFINIGPFLVQKNMANFNLEKQYKDLKLHFMTPLIQGIIVVNQ